MKEKLLRDCDLFPNAKLKTYKYKTRVDNEAENSSMQIFPYHKSFVRLDFFVQCKFNDFTEKNLYSTYIDKIKYTFLYKLNNNL